MEAKASGSITIFSLLSMLLVAATLLTLLEGARFFYIKRLAELQTELALESTFANYNTHLWESYRLLGCNQMEMEEMLIQRANGKYASDEKRLNTLILQVKEMDIQEYTLLTDGNGMAYVTAVSAYMEDNILYETAKTLYNQYESMRNLQETSQLDIANIDVALESIKMATEKKVPAKVTPESSVGTARKGEIQKETQENPLEMIKEMSNKGILELVIQDTSSLSESEIVADSRVSTRELSKGKSPRLCECDWLDRVLLQQYLLTYMSSYTDLLDGHWQAYELEYLIGGKLTDIENLKAVATQLYFIRAVANFLYLSTDAAKMQEATALATTLVGVSANPLLIEAVKVGLVTAWALAESILDVRGLLQGKRIPLLKSQLSWTLALGNIGTLSSEYMVAKDSSWGLSYENYLGILLLFQNGNTLAMRAMDLQEITIQKCFHESDFKMDQLVIDAKVEVIYYYNPIFSSLEEVTQDKTWNYEVSSCVSYGYAGNASQ